MDGKHGERLRLARKRKGLSQRDFARLGGVGLGSQHRYESGGDYPPLDYLLRIGDAGVDWLWVITGRRHPESIAKPEADLLDAFNSLTESDRAALLTIARSLGGRAAAASSPDLSNQPALERMFQGFFRSLDRPELDELAPELATLLPIGLEQLQGSLRVEVSADVDDRPEPAEAAATATRTPRRGSRT